MSGGIVTQQLNRILMREGLDSNFRDSYQDSPLVHTQFLKTGKSDKNEIQMATVVGPNRLLRIRDREDYTLSTVEAGMKAAAVDNAYGSGYVVTLMAMEDDMYGKVNQGAKHLGRSWRLTREYIAAGVLDDAFTGTTYKAQDGLSLINSAHTLLRGAGTYSNAGNAVGFSQAGVTALMQLAQLAVDHNGDPIEVDLNKCILPNNEGVIMDAMKIFGQDNEPMTANRDDNMIKRRLGSVNWFVNKFQTSQSRYFMIDDKLNDAHMLDYKPLMIWDTTTALKDLEVRARARIITYVYDPRGWYGANPS